MKNNLKDIRLNAEVTQVFLAESVGVSRQTIHSVEVMKYVPSVELALKIAIFFELSVEDIFKLK